ncbi:MAG: aconitase X catalytic domain-containing protein [Desulfosarcinaceae bacterium]|nr:aconitase X catalytic domain-containing protein [Desulfosarcinaceae bacterium]
MLKLERDEREMLAGDLGPARQRAMALLVKYANALGADRFIDIRNVTIIPGSIPNVEIVRKIVPSMDIDEIASRFMLDSDERVVVDKVKAFTTTNATWRDQAYPELQKGSKAHCDLLQRLAEYCKRIGMIHLATCTPYQVGNLPVRGEHIAWTESSAVAYSNSVIGARTNIEGLHSAFAAAITGKIPNWGMHLDRNRRGKVLVEVAVDMSDLREWSLLGYYVASQVGLNLPIYEHINHLPDLTQLMALCAAGISGGSVVMHHLVGITPEAPTVEAASGGRRPEFELRFAAAERRRTYEWLNRSGKDAVDIVALGCPHCTLESLRQIAELLDGKKISANTKLYLTTNSMIKAMGAIQGYNAVIEKAGGLILQDSCCLELAVDPDNVFATNSGKLGHYAPGATGLKHTWFGTLAECIDAAVTGKWRGELP